MIKGNVNQIREAVIPLALRDDRGNDLNLEAIVDTGFNGTFSLPPAQIRGLGLTPVGHAQALLADGTLVSLDVFRVTVIWDGAPKAVDADCVDGPPLVGMALLEGFDLHIRNIAGGDVVIEPIP